MQERATNILLVEGKSDFHLIKTLLRKHGIVTEKIERNENFITSSEYIGIFPVNTKTDVNNVLREFLDDGYTLQLGIVVDADQSAASTYQSITDFVTKQQGTAVFPSILPTTGTITTYTRPPQPMLRLGLWVMPNNQDTGFLEHFASELIPPTDQLWPLAQQTITNLPERRYPTNPRDHTRKAELHTWLAWQKRPGKPMGLAVSSGYLQHDALLAQNFVTWIRAVFSL